tara:strand:- start:1191 stop:1736 length:546 start_codon:yes stop_codon:yes gene_type:complete
VLKSILRKKLIKKRKSKVKSSSIISLKRFYSLIKNHNLKKKIIGGYFPVNNEIDDLDLLTELEKKKINISLPVIGLNNSMNFYSWSFNSILKTNKYGIPEPEKKKLVFPDIIIVPMVAFDERLYRLGYGGGYYDRYIEKILSKKKTLLIGFAHSCQKITRVPNSKYDRKLDYIITEKYILR